MNEDDDSFASLLEAAMGDLNLPFEARERVRTMPKQQQVFYTKDKKLRCIRIVLGLYALTHSIPLSQSLTSIPFL